MRPVGENVRVAGLYSSALAVPPPAMSTMPLGSVVAVWLARATLIWPVPTQVFGGPSLVVAAATLSAGRIRLDARAPTVAITTSRLRQAQRNLVVTVPPAKRNPSRPGRGHMGRTVRLAVAGSGAYCLCVQCHHAAVTRGNPSYVKHLGLVTGH